MTIEKIIPFEGQHCETTATGTLLLQRMPAANYIFSPSSILTTFARAEVCAVD